MPDDDLRFGDPDAGGDSAPTDRVALLTELVTQGLVLLVVLYVALAFLDVLVFDGAIPIV